MPSLADRLKDKVASITTTKPLWKGPGSFDNNGGITQSLLSRYIACQERFRIHAIEGFKSVERFNRAMDFGTMWHKCEEAYAQNPTKDSWKEELKKEARKFSTKYPLEQQEVVKWYNVILAQFPIYLDWWKDTQKVENRKCVYSEEEFKIPYLLPSGRMINLRCKLDRIDVLPGFKTFFTDHKTKSEIDPVKTRRQLTFDLQTMTYAVCVEQLLKLNAMYKGKCLPDAYMGLFNVARPSYGKLKFDIASPLKGFFYNVIKRPLSGGAGSIRQHQPTKKNPRGETDAEFYNRLAEEVIRPNPNDFFYREKVELSAYDVPKFVSETLHPLLENVTDDYEWWSHCKLRNSSPFDYNSRGLLFPTHKRRHFRLPYGVYNPILEGAPTDLDEYLATGQTAGLQRVTNLFPELEVTNADD